MNDAVSWLPYCGPAPVPAELLSRWNFDPALIVVLSGATFLLWHRAHGLAGRISLIAALGLSFLLFISPFCALSSALFSARVAHHVALTAVIAPILVYAFKEEQARWPGSLAFWTAVQALIFWLWHAPDIYATALSSDIVYWIMQASLLGLAIGFWAAIRRANVLAAVTALLATTVQMGLLGAIITFAGVSLYAPHRLAPIAWGMSPLEDQQLAGLIMWAPSAGLYLAAALLIGWRMLASDNAAIRA
jgi:putative membrane protein